MIMTIKDETKEDDAARELSDLAVSVSDVLDRLPITRDTDYGGNVYHLFRELFVKQETKDGAVTYSLRYDPKKPEIGPVVQRCVQTCIQSQDPWGNARRLGLEFARKYGRQYGMVS